MTSGDLIDIEVTLHADPPRARAILVSGDGEEKTAVWIPRSQIDYDDTAAVGDVITVTLPERLAKDTGLI